MGGYDVFYAQKRSDGTWGDPINLGYPINTTDDDLFYTPIGDGSHGLVALSDKEGYGEQDLFQIEVFIPKYLKSIITSNDLSKSSSDARLKSIVIDTINKLGLALIDITKSGIATIIDPNMNFKLFFDGREYEVRDQLERTKTIAAQIQQTVKDDKSTVLPISIISASNNLNSDINITEAKDFSTVQNRVYQLKETSDSSRINKNQIDKGISEDSKTALNSTPEKITLAETNYLPEILTLLSTNHSQDKVVNAFQKNWYFPSSLLKLRINQMTQAVDSAGNTEELLSTFTKLMDLLCSTEFVILKNQSRTISGNSNNQAFRYLLNQLIDKASPELAGFLEKVFQKHPTVNSFARLWQLMRREDPELFQKLTPEIVRLLAEISIETYISLPEDQKYKLYEKITAGAESKNNWWFLLIILGGILVSTAGYIYLKRKNE
jgi:LPXTG-motif cell wall-anchored protein